MSFLVYLLGVVSIIPVAMWMPNEKIVEAGRSKKSTGVFREYYPFRGAVHRSVYHTCDCDRL